MQAPMTPVRIFKRAVKLYPRKTAIVDGRLNFTYLELQDRVNRVTHAVADLAVSGQGRVAILDYNTHRYLEMYLWSRSIRQGAASLKHSPVSRRIYPYTERLPGRSPRVSRRLQAGGGEDSSCREQCETLRRLRRRSGRSLDNRNV